MKRTLIGKTDKGDAGKKRKRNGVEKIVPKNIFEKGKTKWKRKKENRKKKAKKRS